MYEGSSTSVKSMFGVAGDFSVGVDVPLSSALTPYLFSVVMDGVTKKTQGKLLW